MAATSPRTRARELAIWVAPLVGALVAAVSTADPESVVVRRVVRVASELVEARVCELKVVLRETGTPVPLEEPVIEVMDTTVAFAELDKVDVPEKERLAEPLPPTTANGPE